MLYQWICLDASFPKLQRSSKNIENWHSYGHLCPQILGQIGANLPLPNNFADFFTPRDVKILPPNFFAQFVSTVRIARKSLSVRNRCLRGRKNRRRLKMAIFGDFRPFLTFRPFSPLRKRKNWKIKPAMLYAFARCITWQAAIFNSYRIFGLKKR